MEEYKLKIEIKTYGKIEEEELKEELIKTIIKHIKRNKKWNKKKLRF